MNVRKSKVNLLPKKRRCVLLEGERTLIVVLKAFNLQERKLKITLKNMTMRKRIERGEIFIKLTFNYFMTNCINVNCLKFISSL